MVVTCSDSVPDSPPPTISELSGCRCRRRHRHHPCGEILWPAEARNALCSPCEEFSGEAPKARDPKILTFQIGCGGGTDLLCARRVDWPSSCSACASEHTRVGSGTLSTSASDVYFQCMFLLLVEQCASAGSHQRASQKPPPVCCTLHPGSARLFPQCPILVCMKGWKPWT